jgi:Cu/Ag efflux protein CusF
MLALTVALMVAAVVPATALAANSSPPPMMVAQATPADSAKPKMVEAGVVTVRGKVEAVDTEKKTVTLKGPKRSLTLQVRDPQKLEAIKVGDPVVAKYYEALAIEVKKPGETTPSVSAQQIVATSKPGETPAGAVGEQINATVTVTAIDKKAQTVTVKAPGGATETIKARDPKNLDKIKVGDLVEVTYTRALVISLDKAPAR